MRKKKKKNMNDKLQCYRISVKLLELPHVPLGLLAILC